MLQNRNGLQRMNAYALLPLCSFLLRHSLGKHIQVVLDLKAQNTSVLGDFGQWESALLNLGGERARRHARRGNAHLLDRRLYPGS